MTTGAPELRLVKTLWGVSGADDSANWQVLFAAARAEGFSAIEMISLGWRQDPYALVSALDL